MSDVEKIIAVLLILTVIASLIQVLCWRGFLKGDLKVKRK